MIIAAIIALLVVVGVFAIAVMAATAGLRTDSKPRARIVSSLIIFAEVFAVTALFSMHQCDAGSMPPAMSIGFSATAALLPWVKRLRVWQMRCLMICVFIFAFFASAFVVASYHTREITGNPKSSAGRFWYTAITGQYPRSEESKSNFGGNDLNKEGARTTDPAVRPLQGAKATRIAVGMTKTNAENILAANGAREVALLTNDDGNGRKRYEYNTEDGALIGFKVADDSGLLTEVIVCREPDPAIWKTSGKWESVNVLDLQEQGSQPAAGAVRNRNREAHR